MSKTITGRKGRQLRMNVKCVNELIRENRRISRRNHREKQPRKLIKDCISAWQCHIVTKVLLEKFKEIWEIPVLYLKYFALWFLCILCHDKGLCEATKKFIIPTKKSEMRIRMVIIHIRWQFFEEGIKNCHTTINV